MLTNRSMNIDKQNSISNTNASNKINTLGSFNIHTDKENSLSRNYAKIEFLIYE